MPRRARGWTCTRKTAGQKCLTLNGPGTRKCSKCGKPRPKRSPPKHMAALNESYESYVELNGGEFCGICGRPPSPGRKLDRDHDHSTPLGTPRGLLCSLHNRWLPRWMTLELARAIVEYLERYERRMEALITDEEDAA
jgi:hypothetical protein